MIKYFNMASSICAKPYIDCMLKNQYYIHACIILYFLINLLINNNNKKIINNNCIKISP